MPDHDRPTWHADYFKQKDKNYEVSYNRSVPNQTVGINLGQHADYVKNTDQHFEVRRDNFHKEHQCKWRAIKNNFIEQHSKKHYGATQVTNIAHTPMRFRTFDRVNTALMLGEGVGVGDEDEFGDQAHELVNADGALPGLPPLNNQRSDATRNLKGYHTMSSTLTPMFEKQRKAFSNWQQPSWMGARRGVNFCSMTMNDYAKPQSRLSKRVPTPVAPHQLGYGTDLMRGNHPQSTKFFRTLQAANGVTINACMV